MLKIRKILYPTDFSRCSKQALAHALFLARQHRAEFQMFHASVLHADDPNDPERDFPEADEILAKLFEIADAKMTALVAEQERRSLSIREFRVRCVSPGQAILDHAKEEDIDVIVMGTRGWRTGPFLGSVAEHVVRHAECPVLTLRETEEPRRLEKLEQILVPIDFSKHSREALCFGRELAATYGSHLQLVHVIEEPDWPKVYSGSEIWAVPETQHGWREESAKAMHELIAETPGSTVDFGTYVLDGRASNQIAEFAEKHSTDLIVIPTHGLTGFERLILGSTTERVVRLAKSPVFTVRSFGKSLLPGALAA
ncbi:MAG: universal stress protein [bacterium]|nr:universal stress protein [bacterium]